LLNFSVISKYLQQHFLLCCSFKRKETAAAGLNAVQGWLQFETWVEKKQLLQQLRVGM
jgi:hypothetical protein